MMSPTAAIATIPTVMPVRVKAHGSAVIVETATLTMTATAPKANDIMAAVAVAGGQGAPPTTAGTAAIHPVETTAPGSQAAPQIGSAATKTPKLERKSVAKRPALCAKLD